MADNVTISVVIPTCDRAHCLKHALRTCVEQDYPHLEILVSDNAGRDNTRSVVESFSDSRIRYVNPGRHLGMSSHWEFALEHVRTDYVMFMGDDDGLLDYSIDLMVSIIEESAVEAIRWRKHAYLWPDCPLPDRRNMLKIRFGSRLTKMNAHESLRRVAKGELWYGHLPGVYHSCVSVNALRKLKCYTNGVVFAHSVPDIWVCIMLGGVIDSFIESWLPLSIPGASGKSTGANALFTDTGLEVYRELNAEARKSDENIICSDPTTSVDLVVLDLLHCAAPFLAKMNKTVSINDGHFIVSALNRAQSGSRESYDAVRMDAVKRAKRARWRYPYYKYLIGKREYTGRIDAPVNYGLKRDKLTIDASLLGVANVFDAARLCSKLVRVEARSALENSRAL